LILLHKTSVEPRARSLDVGLGVCEYSAPVSSCKRLSPLSLSFAVPTEDVPETAYDESESLPYEMTPLLSADLVPESAPTVQVVPMVPSDLFSAHRRASCLIMITTSNSSAKRSGLPNQ